MVAPRYIVEQDVEHVTLLGFAITAAFLTQVSVVIRQRDAVITKSSRAATVLTLIQGKQFSGVLQLSIVYCVLFPYAREKFLSP